MRFTVWIPRTLIGVVSSIIAGMALGLLVFWVVSGGEGEEGRLYPALALGLIAALSGGTWVGTKIEQWRARTEIEEERRARAVMSYWLEAMSPAPPAPKGTVSDLDIAVDHPADAFLRRFSDFTRTIRTPELTGVPELAVRFAIAVRGLEIEGRGAILARYARDDTVKRANDAQLEAWRSSRPDQWVRDVTSVHDAAGSAAWLVTLGGIMRRMREATTRSELDAWARLTDVGMGAVVQTAGYLATRRFWEDERAAVGYGSFADIMPFSILFSAEVERELAQ